ncbi:MAG: sigma-54-dependent Fis family transcriptional regulator, partial [Gemmatimonadota bacterium]
VGSSKTRHVDVRFLSATNANIVQEVAEGRFREDLLYRLNTVEIHLPPLRDRREDIPVLANYFLRRQAERYRKPELRFAPDAMQALLEHTWPGNVRELEHVVERTVLMAKGDTIKAEDLGLHLRSEGGGRLEEMKLDEAERHLIQRALDRHSGNVSRAAEALGLSRSALYRRLQRYALSGSTRNEG